MVKVLKGTFNFKPPKIHKRFKNFDVVAKSRAALDTLAKVNKPFRKAVKAIFSKKGIAVATTGGVVGFGVNKMWEYIENNSGCFKKKWNGSRCKYIELSCCQKKELDNVPNCDDFPPIENPCGQYDSATAETCCDQCDCATVGCSFDEEVQCQTPSMGDAMTHFAGELGVGVWSTLDSLFPTFKYVLYGCVLLLILWVLNFIRSAFASRKPTP